jgi:hypothetical protein
MAHSSSSASSCEYMIWPMKREVSRPTSLVISVVCPHHLATMMTKPFGSSSPRRSVPALAVGAVSK